MARVLMLAGALAAVGCAQDFALSERQAAALPILESFRPTAAFGGDVMTLAGKNFDTDPESNEVHFPFKNARAFDRDPEGNLLVKVPQETWAGEISVSTPLGSSPPVPGFYYRGHGHPIHGSMVATVELLHRSPGLVAAGGDVVLASGTLRLLLGQGGSFDPAQDRLQVDLPSRPIALTGAVDGTSLYLALENGELWRVDPTSGERLAQDAVRGTKLLAAGRTRLFAVTDDQAGAIGVSARRGDTLSALAQRSLPLLRARGAVVGDDDRTVLVAGEKDEALRASSGVLLADALDGSTARWVAAPPGRAVAGPMALLQSAGGVHAAVALDDGTLALLALGSAPAWTGMVLQTPSTSPVGGVVARDGASDPLLAVTLPLEGMVVGIDPRSGNVVWTVPVRGRPTLIALSPDQERLYALDSDANAVDEIDATNGHWLRRLSFDVGLGTVEGCDCRAVADTQRYQLITVARKTKQLIAMDLGALVMDRVGTLAREASVPRGTAMDPARSIWVVHDREVGRMDGASETIVLSDLGHPPTHLRFLPTGELLLGSDRHVELFRDGQRAGGLDLPGSLALLDLRPDGTVLVFWTVSGQEGPGAEGALWTQEAIAAGGVPTARYQTVPSLRGFQCVVPMVYGPLLFYGWGEALQTFTALPLAPDLSPRPPVDSPLRAAGSILPTPDGRYFLWYRTSQVDGLLHTYQAAEDLVMYEWSTYQVPVPFSPPTFDESGEWLYVPLPGLDRIAVFN